MHARTPSVGTLGGLQTVPPVVAGPRRERRMPKPMMHGLKKSDGAVRPVRAANKGAQALAESPEERAPTKGNPGSQSTRRTQSRVSVPQAADRIRQAVKRNPKERLTALFHHITPELLGASYLALRKDAAAGVDGVTWAAYGEGLEERLLDLHRRLHHGGAYRVPPVRRVEIPKPDGGTRPLGIAALEDKIVQKAVVDVILTPIFEVEFLGFSYGFRPGRGAHDALDALAFGIERRKVSWVVDADIRAYFDTIPRDWLIRFVEHRIGDRRVTRLIRKWLHAGVMDDGTWKDTGMGTPQGNIVSPRTQRVTSALSARLCIGAIARWLTGGAISNMLMANGTIISVPEGRAAERRVCLARPGPDGERSGASPVAALRVVAASGLSLRPRCARHGPAARAGRDAGSDHHHDSGHAGGGVAGAFLEQRRFDRGDRRAGLATLLLGHGSSWLNAVHALGPLFTSITPSTACLPPSSRTPTRSWCLIGRTRSRRERTT